MYQKLTEGPTPKEIRRRSPVILYRKGTGFMSDEELRIANKFFVTINSRMRVHGGDIVIGRYSVLPYYTELERDLKFEGCDLINSFQQHCFVADLKNWTECLEDMTPKTWFRLEDIPEKGPFVLKGATNSRKDKWNTHMYAKDKKEAVEVFLRLSDDSNVSEQGIYVRQYVPLVTLMTGLNEQPVTEEFRFFVCNGQIISGGYYWSNYIGDIEEIPPISSVPLDFLQKAINQVKDKISFFTIDVAKTQNGKWIVVELNDGQMSGLSENSPTELYKNLKKITWDDLSGT